ncbi:MAG TPA: hypothetical protein VLK28_02760 [Methylomirabilota bacterium]|nr:hypothetical protein [Methylomirabilota bacterium]
MARAALPALRAAGDLEVTLVASGPALDALVAAGEPALPFALPDGSTHVPPAADPGALLEGAADLLARGAPDVLLVTISSLGVGLDEALLARAGGRPTFALQDYPGDANAIGGARAETYFVRDEAAARLTRQRWGVAAIPVGSLRHAWYATLDVLRLRAETRARIRAAPSQAVVGFFAQPPEVPGHEAAFGDLLEALAGLPVKPLVLLREHPKHPRTAAARAAALRAEGLPVHDATGDGPAEGWLAACDVVTTCFSHCSMDYAFLAARSPEPLGSVLFLLTREETRRFMADYAGLRRPDGADVGLGRVAERPRDLPALLERALAPDERAAFHAASRRLPQQARFDVVVEAVRAAGQARARPTRSAQ